MPHVSITLAITALLGVVSLPQEQFIIMPRCLAIKQAPLQADDENSPQSSIIKAMRECFEKLKGEISREASFCLVGIEQNEASLLKLRALLEDLTCLAQRTKGSDSSFYNRLQKEYSKDAQKFERLSHEAGFVELRPEHLGFIIKRYAWKNNIPENDFLAIGACAKEDKSLSLEEKKGMRDVVNFMKHPRSRETFERFCQNVSEVEGVEFSDDQIHKLSELILAVHDSQQELIEQPSETVPELEKDY